MKLKLPHTDEAQNNNAALENPSESDVAEAVKTQNENADGLTTETAKALESKADPTPTTALGPVLDDAVESQPVVRKKHVMQDKPADQPAHQPISATDQLKNAGGFVAAVGAALLGLMGVFVVARGGVTRAATPNIESVGQPDFRGGPTNGAGGRYL